MIKIKSKWGGWVPAIIFGLATISMGVVAKFSPSQGMVDLGQVIYFMLLGTATLGSLVGGVIVYFIKKK